MYELKEGLVIPIFKPWTIRIFDKSKMKSSRNSFRNMSSTIHNWGNSNFTKVNTPVNGLANKYLISASTHDVRP